MVISPKTQTTSNDDNGWNNIRVMSSAATVPTPGQSPSNVRGRDAAKKVVAAYRRSSGLPDDVTWEEIKGENLKSLTASMCFWLASRSIPSKGFDENLQPTRPDNNQRLTSDTLVYYVGLWLTQVRDMFPQHEDFKESNPKATTPWWTEMRSGFAKAASKYQISQGDDVVFGLDKMLPLYKDNKRPIGDVITNPSSIIDVKHVLMHFVSTAKSTSGINLQTRCWIALTSDCIGRGGEFRFQSYDDWIWHPAIQVLDIKWKEMKNIHVYSMGIVPDLVH
ncbi:hypothetical protein IV203_013593 [Nitzschia inconspicua]|uniref:Uncharacterized protein n=1 Tax=Nitzschia inconspicua TaxID=303405 RepID=A0A9K3M5E9_9STRA|nr:hypothetical protein IV203_013593 [Nitzschia inconspicua]